MFDHPRPQMQSQPASLRGALQRLLTGIDDEVLMCDCADGSPECERGSNVSARPGPDAVLA